MKSLPSIPLKKSEPIPKDTKSIIFVGPVHAWSISAPLKQYLLDNKDSIIQEDRKYYIAATMGTSGADGFKKDIVSIIREDIDGGFAITSKTAKALFEKKERNEKKEI